MKRLMSALALALLLVAPVPAWAGEIEGKIQKIDSADRVLVLEDGTKLSGLQRVVETDLEDVDLEPAPE